MVQPVVLKKRHSLKGLTLLPVIRKVKDGQLENVKELARISVGKRTEALQLRDIAKAVMEITGEPMDELLELAGKDIRDCDAAKLLLHYCVLAANERGQPKGQVLQDDEAGPSTSSAPAERQNQTEDNTVENEATPVKKRKTIDDMERRLLMLEKLEKEDVSTVKERVKALAAQQDPSEPLILITLDELARLSRKLGDKDMEVYEELYRQCGRLQGKVNIANLCLTVLGGQGADLVSKAVNKCIKEGQNLGSKCEGVKMRGEMEQDQGSKGSNSPLAGLYPMYSTPLLGAPGFQPYPFHPFSNFGTYSRPRGYRPMGGMGRRNASRLACHFCDSTQHLVKDCELMKAARRK